MKPADMTHQRMPAGFLLSAGRQNRHLCMNAEIPDYRPENAEGHASGDSSSFCSFRAFRAFSPPMT